MMKPPLFVLSLHEDAEFRLEKRDDFSDDLLMTAMAQVAAVCGVTADDLAKAQRSLADYAVWAEALEAAGERVTDD